MPDFSIRSDSVDVEQIMRRIRARIREKRGVDYTEDEIRELANVKLEKFLDPDKVRSDLIEHYRRQRPIPPLQTPPAPPNYGFEDETIYASSRSLSGRIIRLLRRILHPALKLLFNPNPVINVLHMQSAINAYQTEQFDRIAQKVGLGDELHALHYEVLNNLVVEMTKLGIEVKNLKMRVESLSSRLDFDERRARALEGVVQYRPASAVAGAAAPAGKTTAPAEPAAPQAQEGEQARRRRRRRRGRRRGPAPATAATEGAADAAPVPTGATGPGSEPAAPTDSSSDDSDGPDTPES
ncbi:MAG: hypothetical protein HYX76_09720 [Acidobacteria bacterium]|nr:hypothetical protein [Acidobacteriota bacterium]